MLSEGKNDGVVREIKPVVHRNAEEIDLFEFLTRVSELFKKVFRVVLVGIAGFRRIVLRNLRLLFSLWFIGLLSGVALFYLTDGEYRGSIIMSSKYFNHTLTAQAIDRLNELAADDLPLLETILGVDNYTAASIKEFKLDKLASETELLISEKVRELISEAKPEVLKDQVASLASIAEMQNVNSIVVVIVLSRPVDVETLNEKIVAHFYNSGYIRNRMVASRRQLLEKKIKLMSESPSLDSLLNITIAKLRRDERNRTREGSNNVILTDANSTNPLELMDRKISLFNELQSLDMELEIQSDFEVLQKLTVVKTGSHKALVLPIVSSFGLFMLGLFGILLMKFDRYLDKLA